MRPTRYGKKIRDHAERMYDQRRAQNAVAFCLINMFPDPVHEGHGYHAKFADSYNRAVYNKTLKLLGLPWGVPDIGRQNGLVGDVAKHIDNSQTKRLGQHAYSVRKQEPRERIRTFLEVCQLPDTEENMDAVREMVKRFISTTGPQPTQVDEILDTEDKRIRPVVQESLFATEVMHVWGDLNSPTALCGSGVVHQCQAKLTALGFQLAWTSLDKCSKCGVPVCPDCLALQKR